MARDDLPHIKFGESPAYILTNSLFQYGDRMMKLYTRVKIIVLGILLVWVANKSCTAVRASIIINFICHIRTNDNY